MWRTTGNSGRNDVSRNFCDLQKRADAYRLTANSPPGGGPLCAETGPRAGKAVFAKIREIGRNPQTVANESVKESAFFYWCFRGKRIEKSSLPWYNVQKNRKRRNRENGRKEGRGAVPAQGEKG